MVDSEWGPKIHEFSLDSTGFRVLFQYGSLYLSRAIFGVLLECEIPCLLHAIPPCLLRNGRFQQLILSNIVISNIMVIVILVIVIPVIWQYNISSNWNVSEEPVLSTSCSSSSLLSLDISSTMKSISGAHSKFCTFFGTCSLFLFKSQLKTYTGIFHIRFIQCSIKNVIEVRYTISLPALIQLHT